MESAMHENNLQKKTFVLIYRDTNCVENLCQLRKRKVVCIN